MRIVSYNIRFGGGSRAHLIGGVLEHLRPDVALLQEASDPRALRRIASAASLGHVIQRPGWSVAALLREPPLHHRWFGHGRGGCLEVCPLGERPMRLVDLHLPAGMASRRERVRLASVDTLLRWLGDEGPDDILLIGDLNSVARGDEPHVRGMPLWLRMTLRFDGRIRTDVQDRLAAAGWVDAFRGLHPGDPGFTLPARRPLVRLDYALVPARLMPRVRACEVVRDAPMASRASDHLPLLTILDD